jgi:hypothetical protein
MASLLDTLGSYFIGGLVLLMLVGVMLHLQGRTHDTVLAEISQVTMAEMSQTFDREINNLGYRVEKGRKIRGFQYDRMTFLSDYDNNGSIDTLTYSMLRTPNGPQITRTVSTPGRGSRSWTARGSLMLFTAYDSTGTATTNLEAIRGIETTMLTSNVLFSNTQNLQLEGAVSTATADPSQIVVLSHDKLIQEAVDCEAGAYYHKVVYPRNLGYFQQNYYVIPVAGAGTGTTATRTPAVTVATPAAP